jgi:citronellol/citronellal dehydrogenase
LKPARCRSWRSLLTNSETLFIERSEIMASLAGKTLFISGGSRGIGKAIALRAASDGANIVIAAKTTEPHPKLPGTIYTAAKEIEDAGGKALPVICDIRFEDQVVSAMEQAVARFGGIDILINNASAVNVTPTLETPMKRVDLMFAVNVRGTFLCSQAALPHLLKAENPHILMLSPPLDMRPKWFADKLPYTISKYGMSMCVLGLAEEFKGKVGVNALWPRSAIATDALKMIPQVDLTKTRKPEILSDCAHWILTQDARICSGNFFIDDELLANAGITDLHRYSEVPGTTRFDADFFIDEVPELPRARVPA